jgi:hypothetical protein
MSLIRTLEQNARQRSTWNATISIKEACAAPAQSATGSLQTLYVQGRASDGLTMSHADHGGSQILSSTPSSIARLSGVSPAAPVCCGETSLPGVDFVLGVLAVPLSSPTDCTPTTPRPCRRARRPPARARHPGVATRAPECQPDRGRNTPIRMLVELGWSMARGC